MSQRTKGQTIYETLHKKLKIEQHEAHRDLTPEGLAVLAPLVAPLVLL
jgi:hypothetical protein